MSELSDKIIVELEGVSSAFKDKKFSSWHDLGSLISEVVPKVEGMKDEAGELLKSDAKKEVVIEVILHFVKIPYVPKFIVRMILSRAIDALIGFLNRKFGNDWLKKLGGKP